MSFTLATLKTAIQDYTDNNETVFVSQLNNFIKAAEEKIFKSIEGKEKIQPGTLTGNLKPQNEGG